MTAVPGVVEQGDLDARLVNVVPALGVALALALTLMAVRRHGAAFVGRAYGDRLRVVSGVVLVLAALPWLAAEVGFYFPGDVFLGEEVPEERDPGLAAVHLGFHHGTGGTLLALSALVLSRAARSVGLAAYLSALFAYGAANAFQDAWNEQLWKRGTVDWHVPDVIRPELSFGWLAIVLLAALVYALWFRPRPG